VPVLTNPHVVFRVGPGPRRMRRVHFREGWCYELNNRAKHEVMNGSPDEARVHLIFDWVPRATWRAAATERCGGGLRLVQLGRGAALRQTRRRLFVTNYGSGADRHHGTTIDGGGNGNKGGSGRAVATKRTDALGREEKKARVSAAPGAATATDTTAPIDTPEDVLLASATELYNKCVRVPPPAATLGSLTQECKSVALPVFQALRSFSNGETTTRVLRRRLQALLGADSWRDAADVFVHACPDPERRDHWMRYLARIDTYLAEAKERRGTGSGSGGDPTATPAADAVDTLDSEYEFDELDMVGDDAANEHAFASPQAVRPLPGFVIAGVMKSGTTSLYDLLMQHPCCRRGRQKEPHVMDWRFAHVEKYAAQYLQARAHANQGIGAGAGVGADEDELHREVAAHNLRRPGGGAAIVHNAEERLDETIRNMYLQFFGPSIEELGQNAALTVGDGSPSYIMGGAKVARRIRKYAPGAKVLIILRNPVQRCVSQYNMIADRNGTPGQLKKRGNLKGRSFEQVVREDLASLDRFDWGAIGGKDEEEDWEMQAAEDERFEVRRLARLCWCKCSSEVCGVVFVVVVATAVVACCFCRCFHCCCSAVTTNRADRFSDPPPHTLPPNHR
jgi:hypothetical protein